MKYQTLYYLVFLRRKYFLVISFALLFFVSFSSPTQQYAAYSGMPCGSGGSHCQPPGYHKCGTATGGVCGPQFNCCADSAWNFSIPPKGQVSQGGGYVNEVCGSGGKCVDANTNASGCGPVNTGVCKNDLHPLKCCTGGAPASGTGSTASKTSSSSNSSTPKSTTTSSLPAPAATTSNPYSKCGNNGVGTCQLTDVSKNKNVSGYTCTYNSGVCASNSNNKYCCSPTSTSSSPTQRLGCVGNTCQYITGTGSQNGCQNPGDVCGSNGIVTCVMLRGCCTKAGLQAVECPLASAASSPNQCGSGSTCYLPASHTAAQVMFGPSNQTTVGMTKAQKLLAARVLAAQIVISTDTIYYDVTTWQFKNAIFKINNVPSGQYNVILHVDGYLNKQLTNDTNNQFAITQGQTSFKINPVVLTPGDVAPQPNGDNMIDIQDYNLVAGCLGMNSNDEPTRTCAKPSAADITRDGKIDQADLNKIETQFGKKGNYFIEKPDTFSCVVDPACEHHASTIQLCPLKCTKQ